MNWLELAAMEIAEAVKAGSQDYMDYYTPETAAIEFAAIIRKHYEKFVAETNDD